MWLIGARGGVATTAIVGLIALERKWIGGTGSVSELPRFQHLDLPSWDSFVVGGHEIRGVRLADEAARLMVEMRPAAADLAQRCRDELDAIDARIRPGTMRNVGPTIAALADAEFLGNPRQESAAEAVARLQQDLNEFARENKLEHVVVVNVASTEPAVAADSWPSSWAELEPLLAEPACPLPASSLYAIAALGLGFSYINFTPSLGAAPPAIDELSRLRGGRHAGCDGKTGETLLKSVLAPMMAARNLQVLSWVGHNIFGNLDGRVLDDPVNKKSKLASKDHLLGEILGYRPQTLTSIEFIESLGEWKTAWDHIHFAGFLGTPMILQLVWQGCDSILAAPLVLDLVRLTEAARRRGQSGLLRFLASFFKSPLGVSEHRFDRQYQMLEQWAGEPSPLSGLG
jgi:myo-inositol-1-phosphate synthase